MTQLEGRVGYPYLEFLALASSCSATLLMRGGARLLGPLPMLPRRLLAMGASSISIILSIFSTFVFEEPFFFIEMAGSPAR